MAQIPTILNDSQIQGANLTEADSAAFGSQIGQATQGFGQTISQSAGLVSKIAEIKKTQQDNQWVGDSMAQEQNYINKWMSDPQNNAKTSFSDDLTKLLEDRQKTYEKAAPNDGARKLFRSQFQDFGVSRLHSAYQTTASNQVNGLKDSTLLQIDQAMDGYRISRNIPNVDASGDLVKNIKKISDSIDSSFGEIAPATARDLKDKLITDSTFAAMEYSPELARKILDMGSIEGRARHSIESEIDQAERTRNTQDVANFEIMRQNHMAMVQNGKSRDKLDLVLYQSVMSRDKAIAEKSKDDTLNDIFNGANDFKGEVAPFNAGEQVRSLNALKDKIGVNPDTAFKDDKIYELAQQQVSNNLRLMRQDPVGYIVENNPTIKSLSDQLKNAPDEMKPGFRAQLAETLVRYQGPAQHSDLPGHDDSKFYMNIPRKDVGILSKGEAEQFANQINQGSPNDALKTISGVLGQYPEKFRAIVFNDMASLPDGKAIRGDYWAVYINQNAHWVKDLIGGIQAGDDMKKVSTDKQKDFDNALEANTDWMQFRGPISSDNNQRQQTVAGFQSAIMTFAYGNAQRGMKPDAAIKDAVDKILNEQIGKTAVNGNVLMIPRDVGDGKTFRSNAEVADIGRRLKLVSDHFIPVDQIARKDEYGRSLFPVLDMMGSEQSKVGALHDDMTKHATWQMSPDGKAAILYYRQNDGHMFEMKDNKNKALVINLSDLPKFTQQAIVPGLYGFGIGNDQGIPNLSPTVSGISKITGKPFTMTKSMFENNMSVVPQYFSGPFTTNFPTADMSWLQRQ